MPFTLLYVLLVLLGLFSLVVGIGISGELRRLGHRRSGVGSELPLNSRAPSFSALEPRSGQTFHSSCLKGQDYALLFVSTGCSICRLLMAEIGNVDTSALVAVCHGTQQECTAFGGLPAHVRLLVDSEGDIADRFGALSFPTAVIIGANGRIRGYGSPRRYLDLVSLQTGSAGADHGMDQVNPESKGTEKSTLWKNRQIS